jgi:hypothetical protein
MLMTDENGCTNKAVCNGALLLQINQPVLVLLPLWIFSVDLLPQMLQNLLTLTLNTVWPGATDS